MFSSSVRDVAKPSAAFGAIRIGAIVGGFRKCPSTAVGNHRLSPLVTARLRSMLVMAGDGPN
jgi:hypothetical protein